MNLRDQLLGNQPLREIVEERRFAEDRLAITSDCKAFDAASLAATWSLARDPTPAEATESQRPGWWVIPIDAYLDLPALEIAYTFDEDRVYLQAVKMAEPGDDDED